MARKGGTPENLTPFPKGVSGNPKGGPKKLPSLDILLADVLGKEDDKNITEAEKIIDALLKKAKGGDVRAAELLLDRGWGKVKQTTDVNLTQLTTIIDVTGDGHSVQQETRGSEQDSGE